MCGDGGTDMIGATTERCSNIAAQTSGDGLYIIAGGGAAGKALLRAGGYINNRGRDAGSHPYKHAITHV